MTRSAAAPNAPLLVVFGATGQQGGGLVRDVLARERPDYRIRAVTRQPTATVSAALRAAC